MLPVRWMSATAASTGIFRARPRCARPWPSDGSTASTRRLEKIAEGYRAGAGPARTLAAHALISTKQKKVCDDPEMFATYLTLAREACEVVKAHKDRPGRSDRAYSVGRREAGRLRGRRRQGVGARAVRRHQPLPSSRSCRRMERPGSWRRGSTPLLALLLRGLEAPRKALADCGAVPPHVKCLVRARQNPSGTSSFVSPLKLKFAKIQPVLVILKFRRKYRKPTFST